MPFESYQPGKESREIDRAQREHVQGQAETEGIRLGFARSHTETAKPMDTLKGMIKRAYKEGKLYSEKQASEAAGEVVEKLQVEASEKGIDKIRINPGDRITFRNDSITLSQFDRKEGGFIDIKALLGQEEGSSHHKERKNIQSGRQEERQELRGKIEQSPKNPGGDAREEFRKSLSPVELQRIDALADFLNNTAELKRLIRVDEREDVQIVRVIKLKPNEAPAGYRGFVFGEIIALKGESTTLDISIGVNPKEGKAVLYNNLTKREFARIPWENPSQNLRALKLALALLANPAHKE